MDLAVIQYSMLIGMQQVCSALSAEQFKELQDMVINKFKEQQDEKYTNKRLD